MSEKIEGVSKVSQATKTQSADAMEQSKGEQFQNHMQPSSSIQTSFERLDAKNLAITAADSQHLDVQETPIAKEDLSSQKSGSATDQEQKRQQQDSESEEIEGVSGVEGTRKKRKTSGVSESGGIQSETGGVSVEDLKNQTQEVISKLQEAKSQLSQANQSTNVEIKPAYHKLLRNHLTHIDDNIKIASSKLGIESTPNLKAASAKSTNPALQFLDMITRSESEMNQIGNELSSGSPKELMNPSKILSVQIKLGQIGLQIELFSSLLNKALESVKTIMNIQV